MRTLPDFYWGILCFAGFHMMLQDWMGLERYIEYARAHWIDLPWGVGAVIFLYFLLLGMFSKTPR